jgi:hypothetical protein
MEAALPGGNIDEEEDEGDSATKGNKNVGFHADNYQPGRSLHEKTVYRLMIMTMGFSQMFSIVTKAEVDWPGDFTMLMEFMNIFSFNLEFVKPECSAKMAFWKKQSKTHNER